MRWVRFAPTREMGFLSSRRYILPWVRFAPTHEIGFVRASRLWTRSGGGETARTGFFSPDPPNSGGFVLRDRTTTRRGARNRVQLHPAFRVVPSSEPGRRGA